MANTDICHPISLKRLQKAVPPRPIKWMTGLIAALLLCCFSTTDMNAQCDIVCPGSPDYDLSLNASGIAVLDETVFESLVSSSYAQCLPANGGILEIWEDPGATTPYQTSLPGPTFNCADVGTTLPPVYVTLNDPGPGSQSPTCMFVVTIVDNVVPVIVPPADITVDADNNACASWQTLVASIVDNCPGNLDLSHTLSGATSGTFAGFTAAHSYNRGVTTITWKAVDTANPSVPMTMVTGTTTVTVEDNQDPTLTPSSLPDVVKSANASCEATHTWTHPTPNDNCALVFPPTLTYTVELSGATTFGPSDPGFLLMPVTFNLGVTTVKYTLSDGSNTIMLSFTVTVNDNTPPSFGASPVNVSVSAVNCSAPVTLNLNGFISDNCTSSGSIIKSFMITSASSGSAPFPLNTPINGADASGNYLAGNYTIEFEATDGAGNTQMHTVNLAVTENTAPVAACKSITASLDATGNVTVNAQDLDDGSTDNCGVTLYQMSFNGGITWLTSRNFNCSNIGMHSATFRVRDAAGNFSPVCGPVMITIVDDMPPVAQCKDISVNLDDPPGSPTMRTVLAAEVNNMSHDNCTPMGSLVFEISESFGGPYGPSVVFDCSDVTTGINPPEVVYLRVMDAIPNTSNICSANVTVNDVTPPTAMAASFMANLSATVGGGSVVVSGSDLDAGSTDNCPTLTYRIGTSAAGPFTLTKTYTCADLGANFPVYLQVTDNDGNTDVDGPVTVTINDVTPPTANCKDITVNLQANGEVTVSASALNDGSTDNCNIVTHQVSTDGGATWMSSVTYLCADVGPNNVLYRVIDQSGNISGTCASTITVVDNVPPVAACKANISVGLQSNGKVLVTPSLVDAGSMDACTAVTLEISADTDDDGIPDSPWTTVGFEFDCSFIATNPNKVALRVTDMAAIPNSAICMTDVIIQDNEAPVITCPGPVTIECDESDDPSNTGFATATDNCPTPLVTYTDVIIPSIGPGACTHMYLIHRTWKATDNFGNMTTCLQVITVEDTTAPTFTAPSDQLGLECPASYVVSNQLCESWASSDVPVTITPTTPSVVTSDLTINVPGNAKIMDVNVDDFVIQHTWMGDLTVELTHLPSGKTATLFTGLACADDNMDVGFDDEAGGGALPCPPIDNNFYMPASPLSVFDGEFINGTWRLTITDNASFDGGTLNAWSLNICYNTQPASPPPALLGDVTDEADNCDSQPNLDATFKDYQAFKGFASNTAHTPVPVTYDFSTGAWTSSITGPASVPPALPLLDLSGAPGSITMRSHDDGNFVTKINHYEATIPAMGWVIFDWDYSSNNSDPYYDPFGYLINGSHTQLVVDDGGNGGAPLMQSGRAVIPVMGGDVFGFYIDNPDDACCGQATVNISNFVYVDKLICPVPAIDCPREFCVARMWDLSDDCGNMAATQAQIISTDDTTGPDVNFSNTLTILTPVGVCNPFVDLDLSTYITDNGCSDYDDLIISNNALADFGTGDGMADASGFYAPGTYVITFTIEDECGNVTTHVVTLTVIDDQDPTAKCVPGVIVQLDNTGNASLSTADVNNGSTDNCPTSGLTLSFASPPAAPVNTLNFTTADIGQVPVILHVTDAAGNTNSCTSIITVLGGVLLDAGDASGTNGSMVSVPVTTNDMFTDIGSFSMEINITDGSVANILANPNGVVNVHPDLAGLNGIFSFNATSTTNLTVSWISNSPSGQSLPPNALLFEVKVNLVGAAGTSTPIKVDNEVVNQIIGGVSTQVPSVGLAGTISVLNTGTMFTIEGTLEREPGCGSVPIELVQMNLTGSPSAPPSPINNAAGSYSFDVAQGSTPTVTPVKDINWFNGVDIIDVLLVNQHFLGIPPLLPSPYAIIAADANHSNAIDIADVFAINQLSLNNLPPGLGNTSWRFIDADDVLNPANPWAAPFNESITFNNVQADHLDADFIGVKVGDVDCSANAAALTGGTVADERSEQLPFVAADQYFEAGQEVNVTFKSKDFTSMSGYQTTISFDPEVLEFEAFTPASLMNLTASNFNPNFSEEGLLATNWYNLSPIDMQDDEALFVLTFKALRTGTLDGVISFGSDLIEAKAVKGNGDIYGVNLVFEEGLTSTSDLEAGHFALHQNQPNPFGHKTTIGFNLPEGTQAKLTFTDAAGRVLKVIDDYFTAGYHKLFIDRNELASKGVVFYRLETDANTATRKMIILD